MDAAVTAPQPAPQKLVIQGANPLNGVVRLSGAKNSVLKLMAAALLTPHTVVLRNVPQLADVRVMSDVVRQLGCTVTLDEANGSLEMCAADITSLVAPYEFVSKMRASFNVLGALLGRFGEAKVSLPGGCSIGKRGVDLHIKGFQSLGADVQLNHGYVEAKATKLVGAEIVLDMPSVGATENIMLAAVNAEGQTTLSNAAQEPEIIDLANFLNTLGADIQGAGTSELTITGVPRSAMRGADYAVMPDRIEAATYIMAVVGAGGDVIIENCIPSHLHAVTHKLSEMGVVVGLSQPNGLHIQREPGQRLLPTNVITLPYPGFPTDLQAPMMSLLTIAEGTSILTESIYENRFKHIGELKRMGAQIQAEGNAAIITGVPLLNGAPVQASDLRAGAALVIAGLMAHGTTEIYDLYHLDRGYEQLEKKLASIGANIQRVTVEQAISESLSVSGAPVVAVDTAPTSLNA
jgi:UDP-N-acetylglucosamine 1-carboxyvinyltransferase